MGTRHDIKCASCRKMEVETFMSYDEDGCEEEIADVNCISCNSKLIEKAKERAEFNYYHPGGK